MDAVTVEKIADLGRKSAVGALVDLDPRHKLLTINGEHKILDIDIPEKELKQSFVVNQLSDFAEILDNRADEHQPVLFTEHGATCLLDVDAHESCTVDFERTDTFTNVARLYTESVKLQHTPLLRFLRVLPIDPGVLATLRTLDFQVLNRAISNRAMGQESLDKSVKAEMGEASGKPTHFFLTLHPFKTVELSAFTITARIEMEYHIQEAAVELWWDERNYEEAQRAWTDLIRDQLQQKCAGRSIIHGTSTIKRV